MHNRRSRLVDSLVSVHLENASPHSTVNSHTSLFMPENANISQSTASVAKISDLSPPPFAVQRLESATANLTRIVEMIVHFKDDAMGAAGSVSKLTRLLGSTPENQYSTCVCLHKLSQRQASRNALAAYPQLIEGIVKLLQTTQDIKTQTEAALALRHLCSAKSAASIVRDFLSVPNLVKLLSHPTDTILLTALSILHKLMIFFPEECRPNVRDCGGAIQLANLLSPDQLADISWLTVCVDSVRMTAYEDQETKLILLDAEVPDKIVQLFRIYKNVKLNHALARLVKVLSVCTECKQGLVEAGAIQVLTDLLNSSHSSLVLETLWGLRNLSDQAFHLIDTNALLRLLVPLISSPVENIAICTVGCLCNLTCENTQNKQTVIELGGVAAFCACLHNFLTRDEVTEPICSALRNVTHRNKFAVSAINQIQSAHALPDVANLLTCDKFPAQLPLFKAVIGLLRNLGQSRDCRIELQNLGVTTQLLNIFNRASEANESSSLRHKASSILSDSTENSYIEGVRLEDLLEQDIVALQSMAKHSPAREQIIQASNSLSIIMQYLYNNSEYLQRAVLGLLSEVAVTQTGAQAIEQEGVVARITELVQSTNTATATYSATVLHRIAQLKPTEYQRRLSQELRQSLFDGGVVRSEKGAKIASVHRISTPGTSVHNLPEVPQSPIGNGIRQRYSPDVIDSLNENFKGDLKVEDQKLKKKKEEKTKSLQHSPTNGSSSRLQANTLFVIEGREAPQMI